MKNSLLLLGLFLGLFLGAAATTHAQDIRAAQTTGPTLLSAARSNAGQAGRSQAEPGLIHRDSHRAPGGDAGCAPRHCAGRQGGLVTNVSFFSLRPGGRWFWDGAPEYDQTDYRSSSLQGVRFGVKAGADLANVTGSNMETKVLAGFHGGLMADYAFSDLLSFHPELLLAQKGAKYRFADPFGLGISISGQERTYYLDLPLLLRAHAHGLFVEAGPQLGYLLAIRSESTTYAPGLDPASETSTDLTGYRRLDFGYVVGVGYQLPQGLEVGVRYNGGFSDLADPSESPKIRNSVFQLQVGYLFGGK